MDRFSRTIILEDKRVVRFHSINQYNLFNSLYKGEEGKIDVLQLDCSQLQFERHIHDFNHRYHKIVNGIDSASTSWWWGDKHFFDQTDRADFFTTGNRQRRDHFIFSVENIDDYYISKPKLLKMLYDYKSTVIVIMILTKP